VKTTGFVGRRPAPQVGLSERDRAVSGTARKGMLQDWERASIPERRENSLGPSVRRTKKERKVNIEKSQQSHRGDKTAGPTS